MSKLSKDCTARVIGAEARKLVHYRFSSERWEYHEETGRDMGRDCTIELIENEQWINKKIEGQIKGTRDPKRLAAGEEFTFSIDIKTINYALSSSTAYVLSVFIISTTVFLLSLLGAMLYRKLSPFERMMQKRCKLE